MTLFLAMRNEALINLFTDFIADRIGAKIIGSCHPELDVLNYYTSAKPSILLLDIKKDSLHSFETVASIVKFDSQAKVIGITSDFNETVRAKLEQHGASGYLLRNDDLNAIVDTIQKVNSGEFVFPDRKLQL
jgi:two-component system response regulator EvgA